MRNFVRKIALLFMVCGLAVSVSFGAMDESQKENCEKAKAYRLNDELFNKCLEKSTGGWGRNYNGDICPIQRFIALCEFVEKNSPADDKYARETLKKAWKLNRDKKSEYYSHFGSYGDVLDKDFVKAITTLDNFRTNDAFDKAIEQAESWKEGKKWESYRNNAIGGIFKENAEALEGSRK